MRLYIRANEKYSYISLKSGYKIVSIKYEGEHEGDQDIVIGWTLLNEGGTFTRYACFFDTIYDTERFVNVGVIWVKI